MDYEKRAIKSIIRQPLKNLIFLLLIFIIGNLLVGAIAVRQAVEKINGHLRSQIPPVGIVSFDITNAHLLREAFIEKFGEHPREPTHDEILQIAALPSVRSYEFSISTWAYIQGWNNFIHERTLESIDWASNLNSSIDYGKFEQVNIEGVSHPAVLAIESGGIYLVAGRTFTQEEIDEATPVIIISQVVADLNDLTIGSTITLENIIFDDFEYWEYFANTGRYNFNLLTYDEVINSSAHSFEVIGIFDMEDFKWEDDAEIRGEIHHFNQMQNTLYLPIDWASNLRNEMVQMENERTTWINQVFDFEHEILTSEWGTPMAFFLLHNPLDFEAFALAANEILPPSWIMVGFSDGFNFIFHSMEDLNDLAEMIVITVSGASIIIVTLLVMLFMKERKIELGIYLALGEKKCHLYFQILFEIFIVAALGLTLSLFTGRLVADQLSRNILINQMEEQLIVESDENWWSGAHNGLVFLRNLGLSHELTIEEVTENYRIKLDAPTLGLIYGIGSATILLSTLVPLTYVTKISPRKVLL